MHEEFMNIAIKEAKKAYRKGEVPVGAIIVKNKKIISKAYNKVEKKSNATLHAEIIAIAKASKKLKNWRLIDCDIYVTLEPCDMCKAAISLCRIRNVYYAASRGKNGKIKTKFEKINECDKKCSDLLKIFFSKKRN